MAVLVEKTNVGWTVSRMFDSLPAAMAGVSKLAEVVEQGFQAETKPLTPEQAALIEKAEAQEAD